MQGVRIIDNVVEVEPGLDTAAYAALEVLFQPIELPLIVNPNGVAVITSIVLTDYDDQGVAINLVFLRSAIPVGANNTAMLIAANQLDQVLGHVNIAATDYLDLTNNQVATKRQVGLILLPDPRVGQSIWMAGQATAAQTYASGRLTIKVGALRG
jgi:hypothetical protein